MLLAEAEGLPIWVAILVPVAILVYYLGNIRAQRGMSERATKPRGRRDPRSRHRDDPQFSAMVGRMMQRGLVTNIREADAGPVLIRGKLTTADSTLGGPAGRETIWQNRSGAPRDAAIAAEYAVVADATGRATIENLIIADVIAPEEKLGPHRAYCALRLGDEVEIVARFKPERFGQDPDPTRLVYGTLGADGNLHIRVCSPGRTQDPASPEPAPATDGEPQSPSGITS